MAFHNTLTSLNISCYTHFNKLKEVTMRETFLALLRDSTPLFTTLQEENRQEIVSLLVEKGGLSVTEITEEMSISRPAISHHLKLLLQAGIVYVEKRGKERIYYLDVACIKRNLKGFMQLLEKI